jgi:MSHA biogenesis protein MshP
MYPDHPAFCFINGAKKQQGSALVIAVFIIVVMTLLVGALSRLLSSSSESVSYEVLGTRAFFAAQSGLEQGLVQIFPLDGGGSYCAIGQGLVTDPSTEGMADEQQLSFAITPGLQGCQAVLYCKSGRKSAEATETIYYQLTSTGQCGSGQLQSSRTIQMEVWQ